MPLFEYRAIDAAGKPQKGSIEADALKTARQKLKKQGLMVTSISEKNTLKAKNENKVPFAGLFSGRLSTTDIALITRQLASLVKANIPLVEALNALVDQTENDTLKFVLSQVKQDVNEGSSLAKAMGKHTKAFDPIYVNMIDAGESSGTLGVVLLRLADLKEGQMRLKSKVSSAMTYPILMMVVSAGLMIAIFAFVIPKLAKVFESMNKPMPATTRFLIWLSDFILSYWYAIIVGGTLATILFLRFIRSEGGRPKWDAFKLRAPLFGVLIRMVSVTRFAGTMGTLLSSGVPILNAMNISKNLIDNIPIQKAIINARENITEGQSIAEPLRKSGEFPPLVIHMIAIGEKTGELPDMLRNIAETYEEQLNSRIEKMTAMIEPLMIVCMGGVVGFIVISIFVPLLNMSSLK